MEIERGGEGECMCVCVCERERERERERGGREEGSRVSKKNIASMFYHNTCQVMKWTPFRPSCRFLKLIC